MIDKNNTETVIFGGGCFWCTEAVFKMLNGVISVMPGYAGALPAPDMGKPTYEKVSTGTTGYAECIEIKYDPEQITFYDLLSVFFNTHDPTTLNKQGADVGTQYRSVIFYTTEAQREEAERLIKELNDSKAYDNPTEGHEQSRRVVTEVKPRGEFFEAEDYHKDYYEKNKDAPYCEVVIAPKLEKLQKRFGELLK